MNILTNLGVSALIFASTTGSFNGTERAKLTYTESSATSSVFVLDNEIKRLADTYNMDIEVSKRIIDCESKGSQDARHYNYKDGVMWSTDVGYWQINDYYHKEEAKKLGFDIYVGVDNLEYGFILQRKFGYQPWLASKACWQ